MSNERTGFALLEVLVALTIAAAVILSGLALTSQLIAALDRAHAAETNIGRANALMTAISLWPREDLDRRLGSRAQGQFEVTIMRPHQELYGVSVRDHTGKLLLTTALYRPTVPER